MVIYSDDLGTTQVNVALTQAPNDVDLINQAFVVVVADGGYVYGSYDAARTFEVLDAANATVSNLTSVMIARDNPQVIYAASNAADVIIKTENGGRTWAAVTATGMAGTGPTSLLVIDQNHVLVGSGAGEIWESSDGGTTWTEQADLPGMTVKVNITVEDIKACACGDLGLVVSETTGVETFFYRNVDGGASGRWDQPEQETATATYAFYALACCGSSHFIAVGGKTVTADEVLLLV